MNYTWCMIRVFLVFKSTPIQFQTIIYASAVTSNVGDFVGVFSYHRTRFVINEKNGILKREGYDNDGKWIIDGN